MKLKQNKFKMTNSEIVSSNINKIYDWGPKLILVLLVKIKNIVSVNTFKKKYKVFQSFIFSPKVFNFC